MSCSSVGAVAALAFGIVAKRLGASNRLVAIAAACGFGTGVILPLVARWKEARRPAGGDASLDRPQPLREVKHVHLSREDLLEERQALEVFESTTIGELQGQLETLYEYDLSEDPQIRALQRACLACYHLQKGRFITEHSSSEDFSKAVEFTIAEQQYRVRQAARELLDG